MCCFSTHVERVFDTRILARFTSPEEQLLVYEMALEARGDLAMILPIPVALGTPDDAVVFKDLSGYPDFFGDLHRAFPEPRPERIAVTAAGPPVTKAELVVHRVGDFVASFVPTVSAFDRLDARFRLPGEVWPDAVRDHGFVVFQLAGVADQHPQSWISRFIGRAPTPKPRRYHPMAFTFPSRDRSRLFYPTLHIHRGQVHTRAEFDHVLYAQLDPAEIKSRVAAFLHPRGNPAVWRRSIGPLGEFVDAARGPDLVNPDQIGWCHPLSGVAMNVDLWL